MRAALLALMLAACAAQQPPAPAADALTGTRWMRVDRSEDAPHFPTLEFSADGASGHAGCNRWHGQAVRDGGDGLAFSAIGATRMMCPPPAMATERAMMSALERTRRAHYDRDALVLFDAHGEQIARFERAG